MKLILASASPRRKELLGKIGMEFEIIPAKGEEKITKSFPWEVVEELSLQKAKEIADSQTEECIVIGSDTIVAKGETIMGKPKDEEDAFAMLSEIAGDCHQVYTGVTLIRTGEQPKTVTFAEKTDVYLYPMSSQEKKAYIASGDCMDKAGSHIWNTEKPRYYWEGKAGGYGIQDPFGMRYIKGIVGDYYNVVGLPVSRLLQELKRLGIEL